MTSIERLSPGAFEKVLYGILELRPPNIVVPFEDDPLYKELQAMAAVVGAAIAYPDITYGQQHWKVDIAEFFKDGSGWRYMNGRGTLSGESSLFPIDGPWPIGVTCVKGV